jgi:chaperone BCS1
VNVLAEAQTENPAVDRLKKLSAGWTIAAAAVTGAKKLWDRWKAETTFTISVPDNDDLYADLASWVLDRIPDQRRRSLTVRSPRLYAMPTSTDESPAAERPRLQTLYDGSRPQTVDIGGHQVEVSVEARSFDPKGDDGWFNPGHIRFAARDAAGRDAVVQFLQTVADSRVEQPGSRLYIARRWGGWARRADLPPRSIDTVVLRAGQLETLVEDLETFFASEAAYARLGVPWHRGLLLEGPPGTGKSSVVRALADRFGLDLWYLPLSDMENDNSLLQCLAEVPARAMLLLEDIDVVHAATARDDAGTSGISTSGLLNALDGVATPHGLLTLMTTNRKEQLDDALLRPGRADRVVHVGYVDADQVRRLVGTMAGVDQEWPEPTGDVAPAEIVEILRRNLDDFAAAELELKELLTR